MHAEQRRRRAGAKSSEEGAVPAGFVCRFGSEAPNGSIAAHDLQMLKAGSCERLEGLKELRAAEADFCSQHVGALHLHDCHRHTLAFGQLEWMDRCRLRLVFIDHYQVPLSSRTVTCPPVSLLPGTTWYHQHLPGTSFPSLTVIDHTPGAESCCHTLLQ